MSEPAKIVTLRHVPPFLLELHSERMVDALMALNQAGFRVTYVNGTSNRYRLDDENEPTLQR